MQAITATSPLTLGAWQRRPSQTLFQFAPVLRSIWQDDLADLAALHTRYWESDEGESGEILIASIDGRLIGITGWYRSRTALQDYVGTVCFTQNAIKLTRDR